jgi:hypothetical protein
MLIRKASGLARSEWRLAQHDDIDIIVRPRPSSGMGPNQRNRVDAVPARAIRETQ